MILFGVAKPPRLKLPKRPLPPPPSRYVRAPAIEVTAVEYDARSDEPPTGKTNQPLATWTSFLSVFDRLSPPARDAFVEVAQIYADMGDRREQFVALVGAVEGLSLVELARLVQVARAWAKK